MKCKVVYRRGSGLAGAVILSGLLNVVAAQDVGPPEAPRKQAVVGADFTYQGQVKKNGAPINNTCDFQFSLWDAAGSGSPPTGGTQIGTTSSVSAVSVSNGLFTAVLDFGAGAFQGVARYLQISVRSPAGAGSYTTLSPRQPLTATPYAMTVRPGAVIYNTGTDEKTLSVYAYSFGGGSASVYGVMDNPSAIDLGTYAGVWGDSNDGRGLYGTSGSQYGVHGKTSTGDAAVFGQIGNTYFGLNTGEQTGVLGNVTGASQYGVVGGSVNNVGVKGIGQTGVWGLSSKAGGNGIIGEANNGSNAYGVWGKSTSGYAGYFSGDVHVQGTLTKSAGGFKIDHPLDPAAKYLNHSFVESPDMKNVYDGVVALDARGEAVVALPEWFGALNRDFRYQLTCIGGYAPVYIAQEIVNNQFRIAGGWQGLRVSWQVTGIRQDPYAEAHRIVVEEAKPPQEQGSYLQPDLYGQPEEKSVEYAVQKNAEPGSQGDAQQAQP